MLTADTITDEQWERTMPSGATLEERLDELLSMARTAGRETVLLAQAERRHENTPRGRKAETYRVLRDQRRVREFAEHRLSAARARFAEFLNARKEGK